jgi:ArsR family transcriptional regulator
MDSLQKVFKTLSDPTRVRVLALLEREELAVQELMDVLGMAQSRVSRHLAILREAGLLQDRREGTYVFYRFGVPHDGPWRDAWSIVREHLAEDATHQRDIAALAQVLASRAASTRSFFDAVGPEWDALRKVFDDDVLRARAITRLVPTGIVVADIGTGTGILAAELRSLGLRVIAVDHSERMLEAARSKLGGQALEGVELRQGDVGSLPLEEGEVAAAFAHMVLHYLPSPAEAIREMARVVAPGGRVILVDFVRHEHEWMREELGVHWLGFETDEVRGWFREAGLGDAEIEIHEGISAGRDLPATFIASARKPA